MRLLYAGPNHGSGRPTPREPKPNAPRSAHGLVRQHLPLWFLWSIEDAMNKMQTLLHIPHKDVGKMSDWTTGTIDRYIDIMQGNGEQWNRNSNRYRDEVAKRKY